MDGILAEMRPLLRMGAPAGLRNLDDRPIVPGQPVFRSPLFLFGILPCGHSDLMFESWNDRIGFVEQSPMTGMRFWRHERTISPSNEGCVLSDRLTFEPRIARRLTTALIQRFFGRRHAVLRKRLGGAL